MRRRLNHGDPLCKKSTKSDTENESEDEELLKTDIDIWPTLVWVDQRFIEYDNSPRLELQHFFETL